MNQKLEKILAFHCAPTLAGIKAANLFSFEKYDLSGTKSLLDSYNIQFNAMGIYFEVLCECNKKMLILVYRKKQLWNELRFHSNQKFLMTCGYDDWSSIDTVLNKLKQRIGENNQFPHEIGMFLSYPLEDVTGFIDFQGRNYKYCGYWKVYNNEEETKKKFEQFTRCRDIFCRHIHNGTSIFQLLEAV